MEAERGYYRRLRDAADIGEVVQRLMPGRCTGTSGTEIAYDCPRHSSQSKQSFTLNHSKGLWHGWGCRVGGDALHLVEFVRFGGVTQGGHGSMPEAGAPPREQWAARRAEGRP